MVFIRLLLRVTVGHDKAQNFYIQILQTPYRHRQGTTVAVVLTNHYHHTLYQLGNDQTVRHHIDRRQIEDDKIEFLFQLRQLLDHLLRAKQFHGVGRRAARCDDSQIIQHTALLNGLLAGAQSRQQIGKTQRRPQRQTLRHIGQTHVRFDHQHPFACLGNGIGQIHASGTFSFAPQGAGNADHAALFTVRQSEYQIGSQQLICLRRRKAQMIAKQLPLSGQRHGRFPLSDKLHADAPFRLPSGAL